MSIAVVLDQLSDRHFKSISEIIETRVGIKLPSAKRTMVEGRLRRRVRALHLHGLHQYGDYLFSGDHLKDELIHLIDCVTTNKTDFFREPAHFDFLKDEVLPGLIAQARGRSLNLKVWSAASSTGAEAYTLAMILQDLVEDGHALNYSILGTDISTAVLREASLGIYSEGFTHTVPPASRARYLMRSRDPAKSSVRIVPELRARCRFERLNLMDRSYPFDSDVDVIFCRNVLIYFDRETQDAVIARLISHLKPGGFLFLGHSESMAGAGQHGLRLVRPTVYQLQGG
jgi:chemotaxis protein methyltransferase CheR